MMRKGHSGALCAEWHWSQGKGTSCVIFFLFHPILIDYDKRKNITPKHNKTLEINNKEKTLKTAITKIHYLRGTMNNNNKKKH